MDERAVLRSILEAPSLARLSLPEPLEADYRDYHQQVALSHIRTYWMFVVLALAMVIAVLFLSELIQPETRALAMFGITVIYALIGLVLLAVYVAPLQQYLWLVASLAAIAGLLAMHVATVLVSPDNPLHLIAQFGVILVAVAVFSISNLLFRHAAVCVALATMGFLALLILGRLEIDGPVFAVYTLGSALVGAIIGFSQEVRARTVFLQARLLLLEKREIDSMAQALEKLSRIDALTGLLNRRCFDEALAREWASCQREQEPLGLLFIDVDHFKHFNDRYGHQAGDACLARVSAVLAQQSVRAADVVARYGGEEFVGLFPRTGREGLAAIAGRIIDAVDALAIVHEASSAAGHVTVSIGVAVLVPAAGQLPAQLVQLADVALYTAKSRGRHQAVLAWESPPAA